LTPSNAEPAATWDDSAGERYRVRVSRLSALAGVLNPLRYLRARRLGRTPPIVIGACPRSGSTLLISLLSCHPRIFAVPEETRVLCPGAYGGRPDFDARPGPQAMFRRLLRYPIPRTCVRWCEKTPMNVLFFGSILRDFGANVRIIHLVRDGRDVVLSRHPTEQTGPYYIAPARWVAEVSAGLRFRDHPQVLTVRYEDLIGGCAAELRRICAFIGEDFLPQMTQPDRFATLRAEPAWEAELTAPHKASIGRRHDPAAVDKVRGLLEHPGAVELLAALGYPPA
jgi:hypothetical protein